MAISIQDSFDSALLALYQKLDLSTSSKIDEQLGLITKSLSELMQIDRVSIWLYENNKTALKCKNLYLKRADRFEKGLILERKIFEPYFEAMESMLTIEASDACQHPATSCFAESYLKPLGIYSMYDCPIWRADSVIGVLCLEYTKPKTIWSIEEKTFSRSISDLAAKIFERYSIVELIETLESKVERRTTELKTTLTHLQTTQERMIVQEKLASLGSLTAGIAHEIKNPLSLITNASEALPDLLDALAPLCQNENDKANFQQILELIRIISKHSLRTNRIVNNMLAQVSHGENKSDHYDLSETCRQSIDLARRSLWAKYTHEIEFQVELEPHIYVSHSLQDITRIFSNILQNSAFAIAKKATNNSYYKGKVSISLKRQAPMAELCIHDNGVGIPAPVLGKVLNPFFTTKNPEEGTGLGLSMVADLVKSHRGHLNVSSVENDFTNISIHFPLIES